MSERFDQPDNELAAALKALGERLEYPETPDLASAVRQELDSRTAPRSGLLDFPRPWLAAAAVLILLVVGAALIYSGSRTAVADWFDIPGFTLVADDPDDQPALGEPLDLGEQISLDEARAAVDFEIMTPEHDLLGEPDEVYLDQNPVGGAVSFVYHGDDDLPAAEETGVGALLTQFQGELNPGLYAKQVPNGVTVERLSINNAEALWISGPPHTVSFVDADGDLIEDTLRFAGNTLIWQDGDLTLRLESALDRETTIAIAATLTSDSDTNSP